MTDDHPAQIHAFLGEHALLLRPRRVRAWVWVLIGTPVARWATETARSTRSTPGSDRARRWRAGDRRLDPRSGDALGDIPNEHLDHRFGTVHVRQGR